MIKVFTQRRWHSRIGFTLIELLVVIMLIGIMASFVLVALAGVTQTAKEDRTKAQLRKIHELVMEKWEQYQYTRVPPTRAMLSAQSGNAISSLRVARDRLNSLRELMRTELPTYQADILTSGKFGVYPYPPYDPHISPLQRAYLRRIQNAEAETGIAWTSSGQFQDAECLYLILSQIRTGDVSALSFFAENEIGDVDGDGMKEILDGWGNPIRWALWAPGYLSPLQLPFADNTRQEDPLDISQVGSGYLDRDSNGLPDRFEGEFAQLPRTLYPLIYSGGPDGTIGTFPWEINEQGEIKQNWPAVGNDPFDRRAEYKMYLIGAPNPDFLEFMADDISNHYLTTR